MNYLEFLSAVNSWIAEHKELVTVIGLPLVAYIASTIANRGAEKRAALQRAVERKLAQELKLAESRQKWISDLRDDIALYSALTWSAENQSTVAAKQDRVSLQANIIMRLNPEEEGAKAIFDALRHPIANLDAGREALAVVSQRVLKSEWERLKTDLRSIEDLQP